MPIYEYQCPKCGRIFEEWVKSSEVHKEEPCPDCGTLSPRIISRTSFVLKGDGWYVSDYGYRKGITDDGGAGAEAPVPATPVTPAPQGEKSVSKLENAPKKNVAGKEEKKSGQDVKNDAPAKAPAKNETSAKSDAKPATEKSTS